MATTTNKSEAQLNLQSAKRILDTVKERRRAELHRRLFELASLPVSHPVDLALRDDLSKHLRAELKHLDDDE
jgi:hypothetical protein